MAFDHDLVVRIKLTEVHIDGCDATGMLHFFATLDQSKMESLREPRRSALYVMASASKR